MLPTYLDSVVIYRLFKVFPTRFLVDLHMSDMPHAICILFSHTSNDIVNSFVEDIAVGMF
jgi:hypothetical protein